jgi:hypothetical protein
VVAGGTAASDLARRDIWLKHDQVWRVDARHGDGDGDSRVWTHDYRTETEARAAVTAMMDRTGGPSEWTDLTDLPTTRAGRRSTFEEQTATDH